MVSNKTSIVQDIKQGLTRLGDHFEDRKFDEWLQNISKVDYTSSHIEYFDSCEEGTCQWFTESPIFQDWLQIPRKVLFCQGVPGAGKTRISSFVIEHLKRLSSTKSEPVQSVAYVYFNHREGHVQEAGDVLSSLLQQLLTGRQLHRNLHDLIRQCLHRRGRPSKDEIMKIMRAFFEHDQSRIYVVLDGLDESSSDGGHSVPILDLLPSLRSIGNISIMITSRPSNVIEKILGRTVIENELLRLNISATDKDLRKYLERRLPAWSFQDSELRCLCFEKIIKASSGK